VSLLLVFLLTSGAWLPLLHSGFLSTRAGGDSPFLLVRLDQLLHDLRAGVFPVRWMPDAAYGMGYPFFNYYAALPYYLAAVLVLCGSGPILALKVVWALGFLASGGTMYALGRLAFRRRVSALLAAVSYVYAPYHLVNVYVRGDSLSEFHAFIWYPLLAGALLRLRSRASVGNSLLLAATYGGLILTHNISALIATPVALAYALLLFATGGAKADRRWFLLVGLAGGLLGLGLSSWFWLPALLEGHLVRLEQMTTGYFHFAGHFRGLDLIQRQWLFDYTIGEHRTPFCMGLVQALLAGLGSLALMVGFIKQRRIAPQGAFVLALLVVTTLCITPLSNPLWKHVPLLRMAQFPWRFLSLQAVFTALVTGCLTEVWGWHNLGRWSIATVVTAGLIAAALGDLRPEWLAISEGDVSPDRLRLYEYFTANIGTTVRWEYLPRTVETRPFTSAAYVNQGRKPLPMAIEGDLSEGHLLDIGPTWETWEISVGSRQAYLAFHTHYFPGWQAIVNGSAHGLSPLAGWGTIGLRLSHGAHRVTLRLGRTVIRWAAELTSLLCVMVALGLLALEMRGWWRRRGLWWRRGVGLAVGGLILGVVVLHMLTTRSPSASFYSVSRLGAEGEDLTMDFVRQPYLHHNPQGVCFGDTARLLWYTLSAQEVQAGEPLTVTLVWRATEGKPLTATVRLVSTAEPLFGESPVRDERSARVEATETVHPLKVPAAAVPGVYLLAVELHNAQGLVTPRTPQGKELGTTLLWAVWVDAVQGQPPAQKPVAQFGERIALLAARAERRGPSRLCVNLTWQARLPIPANYNLSLRLKDPSGHQIAVRDLQPHYGFYPTSLWTPGVPIEDSLCLHIPEETPAGGGYALEVIVYPVSTLVPLGQAELKDVWIGSGLGQ